MEKTLEKKPMAKAKVIKKREDSHLEAIEKLTQLNGTLVQRVTELSNDMDNLKDRIAQVANRLGLQKGGNISMPNENECKARGLVEGSPEYQKCVSYEGEYAQLKEGGIPTNLSGSMPAPPTGSQGPAMPVPKMSPAGPAQRNISALKRSPQPVKGALQRRKPKPKRKGY